MIAIFYGFGKVFDSASADVEDGTATESPGNDYLDDIGRVSIIGNIPTQPINYPENWHQDLSMPAPFVLVEAILPTQYETDPYIWASKFIYYGDFETSIKEIIDYFQEQEWGLLDTQRYYENIHFLIFDRPSEEFVSILLEDGANPSGVVFIQMNANMNRK